MTLQGPFSSRGPVGFDDDDYFSLTSCALLYFSLSDVPI